MADEKDLELENNKEQDKLIEETSALEKEFPVVEPAKVQEVETNDGTDKVKPEADKEGTEEGGEAGTKIPEGDTPNESEQEKDQVGESEIPQQEKQEEEVDGEKKDTTKLDTEGENDLPPETDKTETDKTDENVQDTPGVINNVDELKIKLAEVEFEAETEKQVHNFEKLVRQQQYEKEMFEQALYTRVLELYDKYGIPRDCDVQELAEVDPAKYQILQNILRDARLTHQDVIREIEAPVIEANQEIIFRLAGAEVKNNYKDLTEDEKKETATTFVQIINKYGLEDIDADLKNKVEMSVARAKMICAKNKKNEEPPKPVEEKKEQITADVIVEQQKENNTGKKLDDFKKDIVSTPSNNKVTEVTPDTVNQIWLSKQGNERLEFFKKHQKMIMANLAKGGNSLGYTDRARRW